MSRDHEVMKALREPFNPRLLSWFPKITKGTQGLAMAYIGSRHIMERLDKVLSPFGWQTGCKSDDGQLIKGIAIKNIEFNEWVWRWEPGAWEASQDRDRKVVEALGASTKGIRRAAMEWGIGRYLWFLEGFWVPMEGKKIAKNPDIEMPKFWWALPYDHPMAREKWQSKNGSVPVTELGPDSDQPRTGTLRIIDEETGTGDPEHIYNESDVLFRLRTGLGIEGDDGRAWLKEHQDLDMTPNEMMGVIEEKVELKRLEEMQDG
jgi:hypothetical protein